jgi:hypothetical protein
MHITLVNAPSRKQTTLRESHSEFGHARTSVGDGGFLGLVALYDGKPARPSRSLPLRAIGERPIRPTCVCVSMNPPRVVIDREGEGLVGVLWRRGRSLVWVITMLGGYGRVSDGSRGTAGRRVKGKVQVVAGS